MKLRLDKIEFDDDIYSRAQMSQEAIEDYLEKLKTGSLPPAIEVQKVRYVTPDKEVIKILCLDGKHRIESIELYNKELKSKKKDLIKVFSEEGITPLPKITEIDVEWWKGKDSILDRNEDEIKLILRGFETNSGHGVKIKTTDRKTKLEQMAKSPNLPDEALKGKSGFWKRVAKSLGVTAVWVSECVRMEITKRRASRDSVMQKLLMLGWTLTEIGKEFGITKQAVSQRLSKLNYFNLLYDLQKKGLSITEIATTLNVDEILMWAVKFQGDGTDEYPRANDLERFKRFGNSELSNDQPKIYDVWNFMKKDSRFSTDYPGFLFGQVLMNVLYRWSDFSEEKNPPLIVDPMAGGGSTIDACLLMGRHCRAYDIKPIRREISEHDIRDGYPKKAKGCDFIFLDPPYFKKKEEDYNCPEISKTKKDFIRFMNKLAEDSFDTVRVGGHVALIYGNYADYDEPERSIFGPELYRLFIDAGFECIMVIQTPLSGNAQHQGHDIVHARKHGRILTISRDLYIFRRPE